MATDVGLEKSAKSNNPMALTGFVVGCAATVFYLIGLIPILAVIFSSVGLGTFKPEIQKNRWMAWTGLILGIVFTLMYMRAYGHA